jgi:NAD(P)-dependent dehydrogenase (short-subunit alcohol dehydrogenase family)
MRIMTDAQPAQFAGNHVLILGGAKGIGQALAVELARQGARLSVADIDLLSARATADAISEKGGVAQGLAVDVLSAASIAEAVDVAEDSFGPIDMLVNNVGAIINGHPEDMPLSEWYRIDELNARAVTRGVCAVLPAMLARGSGHIVNTASFAGAYPYAATRIPYAASKAAVISLSQNLALHCEPQGVRVSCLIPGPVRTGIAASMRNWTPDATMRGPGSQLRLLSPEEAAERFVAGMAEGRILIASDDALWDILRDWAADPDAFIRARIKAFSRGEGGLPTG